MIEVLEEYQIIRPNVRSCIEGIAALFAATNAKDESKAEEKEEEGTKCTEMDIDQKGNLWNDITMNESLASGKGRTRKGDALCALGILWEEGILLRKDELKALHCFKMATEMGHPVAQCILVLILPSFFFPLYLL